MVPEWRPVVPLKRRGVKQFTDGSLVFGQFGRRRFGAHISHTEAGFPSINSPGRFGGRDFPVSIPDSVPRISCEPTDRPSLQALPPNR
jgi:hypothetical protein